MVVEFTLKLDAVNLLKSKIERVKELFKNVNIQIEETETSLRTNLIWVTISGAETENCQKAKKYITSLTNPDKTIELTLKQDLTEDDKEFLQNIEQETCCVLDLSERTIVVHSIDDLGIALVQSLLEEKIQVDDTANIQATQKLSIITEKLKQFCYKLGYDDDDLETVVDRFYENQESLNENTLLQELTKKCPQKLERKILSNEDNSGNENESKCVNQGNLTARSSPTMKSKAEISKVSTIMQPTNNGLRDIIIDGSNVAMCHGNREIFSCSGIEIVVNWFKERGHQNIFVFVPQWRLESPKPDTPISNQEILEQLQKEKVLLLTPSRRINGRRVVCYDDRYIVKHAFNNDGIVVSNDNFRDLQKENNEWKTFLEQRLLMFMFVRDTFMPPDDPLGRCGPTLDEFLRKGSILNKPCPYKNKCTFGSKCRFYHPEKQSKNSPKKVSAELLNKQDEIINDKAAVKYESSCKTFQNFSHIESVNLSGGSTSLERLNHTNSFENNKAATLPSFQKSTVYNSMRTCAIEHNMQNERHNDAYQLSNNDVIARGQSYPHKRMTTQQANYDGMRNQVNSPIYPEQRSLHYRQVRPHINSELRAPQLDAMSYNPKYHQDSCSFDEVYCTSATTGQPVHLSTSYSQHTSITTAYVTQNVNQIQNQRYNYGPPRQFPDSLQHQQTNYHPASFNHDIPISDIQRLSLNNRSNMMDSMHSVNINKRNIRNVYLENQENGKSRIHTPYLNNQLMDVSQLRNQDQILFQRLNEMFPGKTQLIIAVLNKYPYQRDLNILATHIISEF